MTQTNSREQPTRERGPENLNRWGGLYTFTAKILSIPVEVSLVYGNALMAWLPYKDAQALDMPPVVCFGSTPQKCLQFVKRNVPSGYDKDWLIEYYTRLDPEASQVQRIQFMRQRSQRDLADDDECREWMASYQFRQMQLRKLLADSIV